jgi:asparagine synthetase B (glutamine-hydrolysing)
MASLWHPRRTLFNEAQEADYAHHGVDVSYPYLDRNLVEFVTSLPPSARPVDGHTKTLVRQGFADRLPASVLHRTEKTLADTYLADVFDRLAASYAERYRVVSEPAAAFLDQALYTDAMAAVNASAASSSVRGQLWNAWMLMQWLDGLARYDT